MKKKDKENENEQEHPDDWEPDWMDPANDRKTPYTEDELKEFAQGFMDSNEDDLMIVRLCRGCAENVSDSRPENDWTSPLPRFEIF